MSAWLRITDSDNVAVALEAAPQGDSMPGGAHALQDIPAGHKAAVHDIGKGQTVVKYGAPIGVATADIPAGAWVHTHNVSSGLEADEAYSYAYQSYQLPDPGPAPAFLGFARKDGQVGIRNELWVIPAVGCVSHTAHLIAKAAETAFPGAFSACAALAHPYGCSQSGQDALQTRDLIAALAQHPNASAVLVLGLGCEVNRLCGLLPQIGARDNLVAFDAQDVSDEVAHALDLLRPLAQKALSEKRTPQPIGKLRLGLKCGGSDGYSGLTANPLVGAVCDRVSALGGSCGMTEVPEMFGAERLLMNRAASREVFASIVGMIDAYKAYFRAHELPVYDNPSPGNKDGGITTLEEKSLGCTHKAGHAQVVDVLPYAGRFRQDGLTLITGPGNDLCACTALAAAGCQLILFTTGRGTPYGGPVPTLKIATNSAMAARKNAWIDYDAGRLLGGLPMRAACDELFALVMDTLNGKPAKAEALGYRDLAILKGGVTQ